MPGSFYVSEIWFPREAMPSLQGLILGELLRQFSVTSDQRILTQRRTCARRAFA
jgi:hypothetical protein